MTSKSLTKKDLMGVFWRSFTMEASFNYERMMSMAFAYTMKDVIKKLYSNPQEQKEAMKRHLEFFNCTSATSPFIAGVACSMEEENSNNPNFDESSINAMKVGLMGPLSGIGDSIFWGSLRIIASGIGISLAQEGNLLGPILFLLIFNIPNILVRYFGTMIGYKAGVRFLENISRNLMSNITYGINILGNIVIGGMVATMIHINIPIQLSGGENPQTIQMFLDSIVPNLLPLLLVFLISYLMKKEVKVSYILIGIAIFSIFAAHFGWLSA